MTLSRKYTIIYIMSWFNKDNSDEWKYAGIWASSLTEDVNGILIANIKTAFSECDLQNLLVLFDEYSEEKIKGHSFGYSVICSNLIRRNKSGEKGFKNPDENSFKEKENVFVYNYKNEEYKVVKSI